MKTRELVGALCVMALAAGAASAQGPKGVEPRAPVAAVGVDRSVTCENYDDSSEAKAFKTAPKGAKRLSDHVFVVQYESGYRRFADHRPYRDGLDGFHWTYCGYVPALHAHLIGMMDDDLFSGKLFLDRSGRLLDAGDTVHASPDGKRFLAASHRNGEVNDHWMISDLSGRRLWTGSFGVSTGGDAPVLYGDPRWIGNDTIRVPADCNDSSRKTGEGALVHEGGTWRWKSDLRCGG